jgi:NAD(P)-dependent dehydrogenase (short-subunit alcohol dehydrogenase family)
MRVMISLDLYSLTKGVSQSPHMPLPKVRTAGSIVDCNVMTHFFLKKGGVTQLTKALSNEWSSKGINVNSIIPGYIGTEMVMILLLDSSRSN